MDSLNVAKEASEECVDPNDLYANLKAGSGYMMIMDFEKAIKYYNIALKLIENYNDFDEYQLCIIKYALCNCYVAIKESEKAIRCIGSLTESHGSKYPILYYGLAIALIEDKCIQVAETVINKGLKELKSISIENSFKTNWPGTSNEIPESVDKTLALRLTSLKEIYINKNEHSNQQSLAKNKKIEATTRPIIVSELQENQSEYVFKETSTLRVDVPEFIPTSLKGLVKSKGLKQTKGLAESDPGLHEVDFLEFNPQSFKASMSCKELNLRKECDSSHQFESGETTIRPSWSEANDVVDVSEFIPSHHKWTEITDIDKSLKSGESTNRQSWSEASLENLVDVSEFVPSLPKPMEITDFGQSLKFKSVESTNRQSCNETSLENLVDVSEFIPNLPKPMEITNFETNVKFKSDESTNRQSCSETSPKDLIDISEFIPSCSKPMKSTDFGQNLQFKSGESTNRQGCNETSPKDLVNVSECVPSRPKPLMEIDFDQSFQFKSGESTIRPYWNEASPKDVVNVSECVPSRPKPLMEIDFGQSLQFKSGESTNRQSCNETSPKDLVDISEFVPSHPKPLMENKDIAQSVKSKSSESINRQSFNENSLKNVVVSEFLPNRSKPLKEIQKFDQSFQFKSGKSTIRPHWNEASPKDVVNVSEFVPSRPKPLMENIDIAQSVKSKSSESINRQSFNENSLKNVVVSAFLPNRSKPLKEIQKFDQSFQFKSGESTIRPHWNEASPKDVVNVSEFVPSRPKPLMEIDFGQSLQFKLAESTNRPSCNEVIVRDVVAKIAKNLKEQDASAHILPNVYQTFVENNAIEFSENSARWTRNGLIDTNNVRPDIFDGISIGCSKCTQTDASNNDKIKLDNDLAEANAKLREENDKLKASIDVYKNEVMVLNNKVVTVSSSSKSMMVDLNSKKKYIKRLEEEINNANRQITSGILNKENLVGQNYKLQCYLSLIVNNLTAVYKENFDSHQLKCKTMINDLENALTVLSKTTIPTRETCTQQLQSWKSELIKTQACLTRLAVFNRSLNDKLLQRNFTTFLDAPSEFTQITDWGSCLHDNYCAAVSNLTKTLSEHVAKQTDLQNVNQRLKLECKKQREALMLSNSPSSVYSGSLVSPVGLSLPSNSPQAAQFINNTPFKSFQEDIEYSTPSFILPSVLPENFVNGLSPLPSLPVLFPQSGGTNLNKIENINDTKQILQKSIEKEQEMKRLSETSIEVLNSSITSKFQNLDESVDTPENLDLKTNNSVFLNGPKLSNLLKYMKSKIPGITDDVLLHKVCLIRSRCGKLSGKPKELILNLVKEELKKNFESNSCCICLEPYNSSPTVKLPCKHMFHRECIKIWLTSNSPDCPVCRTHIPFGEKYL